MFNASDLLGNLLQGGGPRGHSMGRLEHAMGERGLGGAGGPLGQMLGGGAGAPRGGSGGGDLLGNLASMLGASGAASRAGYGGGIGVPVERAGGGMMGGGGSMGRGAMMGGLGALAASVLAGRGRGGMGGGLGGGMMGGGGGLGGLGGGMMGGGGMRGAVGAGGLALLGMLAMKALRNSNASPQQAAATGFGGGGAAASEDDGMPPEQAVSEETAHLVLRAMIDAAKADGRVDATERQRIIAKAQEGGADPEAAAFLERELARPADPDALAAEAARDPVVAAQVYGASVLAIQVDTDEEREYLRALAAKLGLQPAVVGQLHAALGAPPPA